MSEIIPLEQLIYIAMLLLLGTLCSALAYALKVSDVFFLILVGMVLDAFNLVSFSQEFIITISTLALIFVLFKSTSKIRFREILRYSKESSKMAFLFLIFCGVFMSFFAYASLELDSILVALLFAILVYGIDPTVTLDVLGNVKKRVVEILKIEAIINTPITVVAALTLLGILSTVNTLGVATLGSVTVGGVMLLFLKQFGIGIAVGVLVGATIVTIMKKTYFGDLSHLVIITAAIIAYVGSEFVGGSGVLAVASFGLLFGNFHIEHKLGLENFASIFSNTLNILVFILIGTVISIAPEYILKGTFLFIVYLCIRFLTTLFAVDRMHFKERVFMTLNVPKGVDVAILSLIIMSEHLGIRGINDVVAVVLLFILYSTVLSTVSSAFIKELLETKERKHS